MARDDRGSAIGIGSVVLRILQNPAGAIAQAGRQITAYCYTAILAGTPAKLQASICRTDYVAAEPRAFYVPLQTRAVTALFQSRRLTVAAEPRTFTAVCCASC